jgi:CBS domain-containing membrane protein
MRSFARPLFELTAADLMSRDLITIPQHMSLQGAAHRLTQSEVSGAPVTDEFGRCVGVLSATDLARYVERGEHAARPPAPERYQIHSPWQMIEIELLPVDEVAQFMSVDVVSALPGTPVPELARMMIEAHIHRVVILDGERRPVGLVTSTDILNALAYSAGA